MGQDKALEVATASIQAAAMMAGKAVAEKYGGNTMKEMARVVREICAEDDSMTILFLEETAQNLSVTSCSYAGLYEKSGMKELGFCLSCSRDEAFSRGLNPQ